jgi:hypothetical protein
MSLKYESVRTKNMLLHLKHGQKHRINGPAVLWKDGTIRYRQYNQLHRMDGPAVINSEDGNKWYCRGERNVPKI